MSTKTEIERVDQALHLLCMALTGQLPDEQCKEILQAFDDCVSEDDEPPNTGSGE